MKKLYTICFIVFVACTRFFAQGSAAGYSVSIPGTIISFANITDVNTFVIDNAGNKWIGFNSGTSSSFQLIRYNGTQWDTFPAFNALSSTNKVYALAVDATNSLWIGSNAGLTKYSSGIFTNYSTTNSNLVSDTVISLSCISGNIYAGTRKGLSVFNGTNFSNYNHANNGMKSDTVICITAEGPSVVWLGNAYGLEKFNGSSFSYMSPASITDTVNCIYIDAQNNKWLGTSSNGVLKYDNTHFYNMQSYYPITQDLLGLYGSGWSTNVKSICKGPKNGVLFGALFGGVEISATQLYVYPYMGLIVGVSPTIYSLPIQHDIGSNRIFGALKGSGNKYILTSFDTLQFVAPPVATLDVSNANSAFLDINNVNTLITDNSDLHATGKYFVPKQNNTSALYASAMWIGGYTNGSLRTAAMTYRQNGYDFWPGPLDTTNASTDTAVTLAYNKVWKINRYDIANFIYNWNAGKVQNGTFIPAANILNWPAQGTGNYSRSMAPFVDVNHNGIYDPMHDGDYPLIKGDQMIWSVYNDALSKHGESGSVAPLGIEVHASAYAFLCPNIADSNVVLNNTTFYNYQIYNRSQNQYDSTQMSLWVDSDLGDYQDDFVGCNVMNNFGYQYNGENYDRDVSGGIGYHNNLPVFACNILNGPLANPNDGIDNNNNGVIDEANERCLMSGFTYYNNTGSAVNGNPSANQGGLPYYELMHERWENGIPMTFGGSGLGPASNTPCRYLYPGTSDPYGIGVGGTITAPVTPTGTYGASGWTEYQAGNQPGDRRFMVDIGPFTMKPDRMYELDYAFVFTQDSVNCYGGSYTCPINRSVKDNQQVKRWFDNKNFPSCLSLNGLGIKQNNLQSIDVQLYPNPANSNVYIEFTSVQKEVTIELFDILGNLISGAQYSELNKYATIPVAALQSGVYLVKIQTAEGFTTKKFVKE